MKKIIKVLSGTVISLGVFNSTAYADTINNIDNSINNTNINYNVDEHQSEGPWDDEEDYNNYNKIYETPKNVNASKKITIGQNVPYNNITGTGWIKRNNDELIYFENNVQAKNEWKEFPDGYRHFNDYGIMDHGGGDYYYDDYVNEILLNEDGTAESERGDFEVYIPDFSSDCLKEPRALDYVKHTLDVFNWQYNIEYKDTYDIGKDGTICYVETPEIDEDGSAIKDSYTIYLYKYKDRGSFFIK